MYHPSPTDGDTCIRGSSYHFQNQEERRSWGFESELQHVLQKRRNSSHVKLTQRHEEQVMSHFHPPHLLSFSHPHLLLVLSTKVIFHQDLDEQKVLTLTLELFALSPPVSVLYYNYEEVQTADSHTQQSFPSLRHMRKWGAVRWWLLLKHELRHHHDLHGSGAVSVPLEISNLLHFHHWTVPYSSVTNIHLLIIK